jgi:hypothetical protein
MPERCSQCKGTLRRAKNRRALACSAPFRPATYATGGSDGNFSIREVPRKAERPAPLLAEESRPDFRS